MAVHKIMSQILQILVISWAFVCVVVGDDEYEGLYSLTVEHTFDSGASSVFTRRGTIMIQSVRSGMAEFIPDVMLSEEEKSQLRDLAQSDGFYRIRVRRSADTVTDSRSSPNYVYSFMKACALYESRLSDHLSVHVDQSGNLIAASISPTIPYCSGVEVARQHLNNFNTTVSVQQTANGPAPETQAYVQKLEAEKAEKAKGQQADNRGFLAKYWMYIVPVIIIFMMMQNMDPNAAQGGGAARG